MSPPLVAELVRGDEVGKVDVSRFEHPADEANAFRVRNRVGKRLREVPVARELVDAELRELVRTVDAPIIIQSSASAGEHVVDVVGVRRIVVDLERNIAVGSM